MDCELTIKNMPKLPFKDTRGRTRLPFEIIHTEIMGLIKPLYHIQMGTNLIVFIDDYLRLAKAYPLGLKIEA